MRGLTLRARQTIRVGSDSPDKLLDDIEKGQALDEVTVAAEEQEKAVPRKSATPRKPAKVISAQEVNQQRIYLEGQLREIHQHISTGTDISASIKIIKNIARKASSQCPKELSKLRQINSLLYCLGRVIYCTAEDFSIVSALVEGALPKISDREASELGI
jgi:hypothetical protein